MCTRTVRTLAAAVVCSSLSVSLAIGQITPAPDVAARSGESSLALTEVVVVARKVAERLQDVPISVSAFSGKDLQQQSAVKLSDVALLTPGLLINEGLTPGQTVFNIRGQAETSVNASTDPSVGVYVDGLYWARAIGANANLLDLKSAEVLRGPQGTLFGRNTTGGAILLESNDPDFNGVAGSVSATYGNFNDRGGSAILNMPIIDDTLALRIAVTGEKREGYIRDTFNGQDLNDENTFTGRAKVLWTPTSSFSLLFSAEVFENNVLSNPYRAIFVSPTSAANLEVGIEQYGPPVGPNGITERFVQGSALLSAYTKSAANSDTISTNVLQRTFSQTQTYSATAKLDTAIGVVKFIGGYRGLNNDGDTDLDGTPYPILDAPSTQKVHQESGELQLTGDAWRNTLKFATGVFYFHESGLDDTPLTALPALNPNNPTLYDGNVRTDSKGIYGQSTWHLTDALSFTGGLRYSSEKRGVTVYNQSFDAASSSFQCLLSIAAPPDCAASRSDSFSNVSYTAGFDYRLSEDVLAYVKTDKGFRSGGENLKSAGDLVAFQPFLPETTISYEAGLKTELFDHRLRINGDAYLSNTTNLQQQTVVTSASGVASNVIGNAGKARISGFEIEASSRLSRDYLLAGTATYTNARYVTYTDPNTGADLSHYFFDAPKYTFSISNAYTHHLQIGEFLARADYSWTDRRHLAPYNNVGDATNQEKIDLSTAASVGLLNVRSSLTVLNGRLELAAYCRNATNNRGKVVVENLPEPLGIILAERRDPRMFGLVGTYRFGVIN